MKIQPLVPLFATIWIGLGTTVTFAQTVPASTRILLADNTLGTQVTGSNNATITGGLNRGQNLFHRFQDFSVPTGGSATFINPVGNQSIVTRVKHSLAKLKGVTTDIKHDCKWREFTKESKNIDNIIHI